jgi:cytoskeleton protein RodZ
MTDDIVTNPTVPEQIVSFSVGEVLVAARNAKSLTQKDVSNNLRISVKQVNALESNDFSSLPQPMITRGFIRNYARLLEIDAEPLIENYRALMPDAVSSVLSLRTSSHQVMSSKKGWSWLKYFLGIILVLLIVLAWFFYTHYMPKPSKQSVENAAVVVPENTSTELIPLPEVALPAAERQSESINAISTEAGVANADVVSGATANVPPASPNGKEQIVKENMTVTAPVATSTQVATPIQGVQLRPSTADMVKENTAKAVQAQIAPVGKKNVTDMPKTNIAIVASKNVTLSVSEQTWVRVTDKSGAVIYEKMMAANSTDGFDGQPPFNLLIGNANATTLTFLGKPVDLASKTKNNVARFTLE